MIAHKLDWDTEHFGYNIAMADIHTLDEDYRRELTHWCKANDIECVYFFGQADDDETVSLLEDMYWTGEAHLTDVRVTLQRDLIPDISHAWSRDIELTSHVVAYDLTVLDGLVDFHHSRFYYDYHFPTTKVDEMFNIWAHKSCTGYADRMLLAKIDGQLAGYQTVKIEDGVGEIILLGVNQAYRRRGIATALTLNNLAYLRAQGLTQAQVVTQGRNVEAQVVYTKLGFLPYKVQLYYHVWVKR